MPLENRFESKDVHFMPVLNSFFVLAFHCAAFPLFFYVNMCLMDIFDCCSQCSKNVNSTVSSKKCIFRPCFFFIALHPSFLKLRA